MEYCPMCRVVRNMRISAFKKEEFDLKGKKKVLIKTYHCLSCASFVRSEITDNMEDLHDIGEVDLDDQLLKR